MNAVYLLLPLALFLGLIGLGCMIWAVKNNQFEDLEGPAQRILYEDDQEMLPWTEVEKNKEKPHG